MAIADIIAALGAVEFTVDSVTVKAWYGSTLGQAVTTANLPLRVIRLQTADEQDIAFMTGKASQVANVDWNIKDQLLIVPVGQTTGLADTEPLIEQYAADYITAMESEYNQPTADSELLAAELTAGVFEYPMGGGELYHGVQSIVTVKQHLI